MESQMIWELIDSSIKVGIGVLIASMFAMIVFHWGMCKNTSGTFLF